MTPTATIDRATLLPALQKLIRALKADLLDRLGESPDLDDRLRADAFEPIRAAGRTAQAYETWRDDYLEQVAVAWVLACVFVRYMEDNGLIAETYLAGITPDRRRQADDAHAAFLNGHPRDTDREYLLDVFRRVGSIPACRDLFAEGKTPLWALGPTGDGARALLDFWRKIDPETGNLLQPFAVESGDTRLFAVLAAWPDPRFYGDTRFLGDLYQDLSEYIRKKYAFLQTPDFVERFLLDQTLTPALDEFQLEEIRVIDPTCGSGHLLIGTFWRLFHLWTSKEPGTEPIVLAQRALKASCGVDINPYAVAVTRFRLTIAAMFSCKVKRLSESPAWQIEVVCGDSLLHGNVFDARGFSQRWLPQSEPWADSIYAIDDPEGLQRILSRQYHVVVGNPPYIAAKDPGVNARVRARWNSCHGKYSLGVPFTERFFNLAKSNDSQRASGFVGMITANSFMKREFGRKLIEDFLPNVDLTHIIDTAGAYIPGHGTPTVILFGRNRRPVDAEVRALLGIRGEPKPPSDPARGLVWQSILEGFNQLGAKSPYISSTILSRETLSSHPWSVGGGGAAELKEEIEFRSPSVISSSTELFGISSVSGEDDVFVSYDIRTNERNGLVNHKPIVLGDTVRDWLVNETSSAVWPYDDELGLKSPEEMPDVMKYLWSYKSSVSQRKRFGTLMSVKGASWFEWQELYKNKFRSNLSIVFAEVATHNHFVYDTGGKVFKQTAPVIKLGVGATEAEHFALIGPLNSSTACFWIKQSVHNKGSTVDQNGARQQTEAFEDFYQINSTRIEQYPLPPDNARTTNLAKQLDALGHQCLELSPFEAMKREVPTASSLSANRLETERLQAKMVALQEELDWLCYRLYGLMDASSGIDGYDEPYPDPPGIQLGERPFEIAMAREMAAGELETSWFERHGSTPITDIPEHWPGTYRTLVARRAADFRITYPNIALIERPEYKRRWNREPWDKQIQRALRSWLLDRLESGRYWPDPADEPPELASCAALAERAAHDADFLQVAALYAGRPDFPLAKLVEELVAAESVPLLPALRYKPSGRAKRTVWERTWDLQRREDAGEDVGAIPVPPKYTSADFLSADAWRLRGKLDVPKERFVSFPHAGRDGDPSPVVGWAGWDHLRQAQALTAHYERMKSREGWPADRLVPLLAGLDQLVPWLLQWHNDLDPEYDLRMGDYYRDFLADEAQALGYTLDQVRAWEPPARAKGGRGRKKA